MEGRRSRRCRLVWWQLRLLRVLLGVSPEPIAVSSLQLIMGRKSVAGWPSGSSIDSQDTMRFSAPTGVRPITQVMPLEKAAEGYKLMMENKARFRVVLTMTKGE